MLCPGRFILVESIAKTEQPNKIKANTNLTSNKSLTLCKKVCNYRNSIIVVFLMEEIFSYYDSGFENKVQ